MALRVELDRGQLGGHGGGSAIGSGLDLRLVELDLYYSLRL